MNRTRLFFILLLITVSAGAQKTLVDNLERDEPGKGTIRVERDARLDSLIGSYFHVDSDDKIEVTGYRIQVYAGNNTRSARTQAGEVEKYLKSIYPQLPVYTVFKSPRWLCLVGDYLNYEEAYETMRLLKKETPYKGLIILRNQKILISL
jgi:hypothetical protein